ncbi:MAG: hypothetical protein A3F13_02175 [Gammaproteobacteria bacterium RIFCSPHIGHO2_12_FULL_40_19]|nr:MAG: hypothetical protein A3F13_02175 [Gammaproteobacteria bacterium RIFCSPHIGHO2_12_FULL_40_19]
MDFSIIIPCFNEGKNVITITERITTALAHTTATYEILFVDDSKDDTTKLLEKLSYTFQYVRYVHRTNARGLGTAVVEGFKRALGKQFIVMDADLQHPPEILPELMQLLSKHDIVIPSRFIPGGSDGGLNAFRKFVSWTARKIGQFGIKRFRSISDCTSGFFGLKRDVIRNVTLNPDSWKILMEILVKGHYKSVAEIPYQFVARDLGNSKMNTKEQLHYLRHVLKLICASPDDRRFYLFCFVGVLGLFVNLSLFRILVFSGLHPLAASIFASLIAMMHNFLWHDNLTWKERKHAVLPNRLLQLPKFILISCIGIFITAGMVKCFMDLHLNISLGQLIGITVATGWNYFANKTWTWQCKQI